MNGLGRRPRTAIAVALVAAAFALGGCVYLRLLQLKHQIASFDRFFALDSTEGLVIECREPILRADDVAWIGLTPERITRSGSAMDWEVRWIKELPGEAKETPSFDILIQLHFNDEKLARVRIPERYFAVMSKTLLVDMLRSLGRAAVDRQNRSIEARLTGARPDLKSIRTVLGAPTSEVSEAATTLLHYRYRPASPRRFARLAVFDMTLRFDTASAQLLRWQGQTPVGKVSFNFENTATNVDLPPP